MNCGKSPLTAKTLTLDDLMKAKELMVKPGKDPTKAFVCPTGFGNRLSYAVGDTATTALHVCNNILGIRVFELLEMNFYDQILSFKSVEDAALFVRSVEVARKYGCADTLVKCYMKAAEKIL